MANNRIKFPQHIYIDLSEQDFERYNKEDNKSALISKLLEEYYDQSIVKVKIDEKIKNAYNDDIFKEFRIPMLLLEFYIKGNLDGIKNEVSISLANKNATEHINEEVTQIASSENKNITEKQDIIEEIEDKEDKNTIPKEFVVNDDESSKSNENIEHISEEIQEHISSDNKNDIEKEDNSAGKTSYISNNVENNNIEVVKDTREENKTNTQVLKNETPRSGSIDDLLKGAKIGKNKKRIL